MRMILHLIIQHLTNIVEQKSHRHITRPGVFYSVLPFTSSEEGLLVCPSKKRIF